MAKFKFSDARITDIVAILDKDVDGKFILTLDDESYDLEQILNDHVGDTAKLTFTRDIDWGDAWILREERTKQNLNGS